VEKIKEDNENFDKIKIFSSEDEKLKILGELLSNKSSRDIIKLLIDKEMYTNEIVKKLELKVSLVIHHLQKMESIGLFEITNKKIARNGEDHRFFRIPTGMLILPNESKEIEKNEFLKKIFKNSIKFVSIGIASFITWSYLKLIESTTKVQLQGGGKERLEIPDPLVVALIVIIIGLCGELIYLKIKKKG
jgi:hypothetical protein